MPGDVRRPQEGAQVSKEGNAAQHTSSVPSSPFCRREGAEGRVVTDLTELPIARMIVRRRSTFLDSVHLWQCATASGGGFDSEKTMFCGSEANMSATSVDPTRDSWKTNPFGCFVALAIRSSIDHGTCFEFPAPPQSDTRTKSLNIGTLAGFAACAAKLSRHKVAPPKSLSRLIGIHPSSSATCGSDARAATTAAAESRDRASCSAATAAAAAGTCLVNAHPAHQYLSLRIDGVSTNRIDPTPAPRYLAWGE